MKKKILFLCTNNTARSQMAEGFFNATYANRYEAHSAGNEPIEVHSCAIEGMAELGIDIFRQRAKLLSEFDDAFDYVVTMCADDAENCPIFPGGATYLHHPFDDPAAFCLIVLKPMSRNSLRHSESRLTNSMLSQSPYCPH